MSLLKMRQPTPPRKDILPPGALPPDEPIYTIPPIEWEPELSIRGDLLAESRDWGHENLGIVALHARGITGADVVIAICDTGADPDHPDLSPRILPTGHKDFTGSQSGTRDRQGHGTHCCGIAAAASNGDGLIGAAPDARLLICKVLNDSGSGASSWIAAGIRHAADTGADIISLSLGGPSPDSQTRSAIQYATGRGCWVVCAAGNDSGPATSYPGHYPESVAVAATDRSNLRASFSTVNAQNDVAAPGVSILSTLPDGRYGTMSGTSMATPYVAGCLALVRSAIKHAGGPMPSQTRLLEAIRQTSRDIAPAGVDSGTGAGLIDAAALIATLVTGPIPPPQPPVPPPVPPIPIPPVPPPSPSPPTKPMRVAISAWADIPAGSTVGTVIGTCSLKTGTAVEEAIAGLEKAFAELASAIESSPEAMAGKINWQVIFFDIMMLFGAWQTKNPILIIQAVVKLLTDLGVKVPPIPFPPM